VHDEVEVLTGLNHPNIGASSSPRLTALPLLKLTLLLPLARPPAVKLYDSFESKEKFYLAFQLASGGELFEKIASRGKFTEGDAANVITHLLVRPRPSPAVTANGIDSSYVCRRASSTCTTTTSSTATSSPRTCSSASRPAHALELLSS